MRYTKLLESLSSKSREEQSCRRYSLPEIISESYKAVYDVKKGSNLSKIVEAHLEDVRNNPTDIDRLSRQLSNLKNVISMVESRQLSDKELILSLPKKKRETPKRLKESSFGTDIEEDNTPYYSANGPRIGSKVKILHGGYRGQVGEVVDFDFDPEEGYQYSVRTSDGSIRYLDDTDIELIEEESCGIESDPEEDLLEEETELTDEEVAELAKHLEEIRRSKKLPEASNLDSKTLQDIVDAPYSASFSKDRAELDIDGETYVKIGKDKWEHHPKQSHALGSTYSDKEIFDRLSKKVDECDVGESTKPRKLKRKFDESTSDYTWDSDWHKEHRIPCRVKYYRKDGSDIFSEVFGTIYEPNGKECSEYSADIYDNSKADVLAEVGIESEGFTSEDDAKRWVEDWFSENMKESTKPRNLKRKVNESAPLSRYRIIDKKSREVIDSYTDRKDAEDWVSQLIKDGDFKKGDLEIIDSMKKIKMAESHSWTKIDLSDFSKKSSSKAFFKTFKKLDKKLHEGTALTRQESISLYKAANSAMTHLSVELEHNPEFLGTFRESVNLLAEDVDRLLDSLKEAKGPSKANMRSLAKFSEALLREDEEEEDLPPIEDEENEYVGDEESEEESEEVDQFDQEYAEARVDIHKELADAHEEDEAPEVQEKLAQDAAEIANLPGVTEEQLEDIGEDLPSDEEAPDEDVESIDGEDVEDSGDLDLDDSEITDDELAELKKHLTEMRKARRCKK